MNIFNMMDDDVLFCGQGAGVMAVECDTGIFKAFEEYGKIPGRAMTSSGSTLFASLYYSGHDTDWFKELMTNRNLNEFFNVSAISSAKTVFGEARHLIKNDGVKVLLEKEMTGHASLRVQTSITRNVDWSSHMLPVTPAVALAATSIPLVFKPVMIDGVLYCDGGVLCNIPVPPFEELPKWKHVFVYLSPPTQYNDTPDDPLITGLLELLQAVMDREVKKLEKLKYFEQPNVTLIRPEKDLGGGLLSWSPKFALRDRCYEIAKEKLQNVEMD